jgi:hypothetical protein
VSKVSVLLRQLDKQMTPGPWEAEEGEFEILAQGVAPVCTVTSAGDFPCLREDDLERVEAESSANVKGICEARNLLLSAAEEIEQLEKQRDKWKHRSRLFREAYNEKSCEVMALTLQKLDLESLGDDAMRIQRDRARESAKKMIEIATRNLRNRAEAAESRLRELGELPLPPSDSKANI